MKIEVEITNLLHGCEDFMNVHVKSVVSSPWEKVMQEAQKSLFKVKITSISPMFTYLVPA